MNKNRLIKILGISFAVIAIVAALLTVPLTLVGKNRFRVSIETLISESLGYELVVAGDIDLSFFPRFEFFVEDLRLKNPEHPQELASARSAVISVDIWEFAENRLRVDELLLRGVHINQRTEADGRNIWHSPQLLDALEAGSDATALDQPGTGTADQGYISVGRIVLEDSSVDFQDVTRGSNYSLRDVTFEILEANNNGADFAAEGLATLAFFSAAHAGEILMPFNFGAELAVDSQARQATIHELRLGISPMLAAASATVDWQKGALEMRGTVQAPRFDLSDFLSDFELPGTDLSGFGIPGSELNGVDPEYTDSAISTLLSPAPASFNFGFNLDQTGFTIPDFDATLGTATIDADFKRLAATASSGPNLNYSIRAETLDLSFLDTKRLAFWQKIALGFIAGRRGNTTASIDIEGVTGARSSVGELQMFISTEGNVQNIELQPLAVWGGEIGGVLRVENPPAGEQVIELEARLRRVDFNSFSEFLTPENLSNSHSLTSFASSFSGKLSADLALSASGDEASMIADSVAGDITFDLRDNTVDIGLIKQVFSSISALSPVGGSTEDWTDSMSFNQLGGFINFTDGMDEPHRVNLIMDNLEINGSGSTDIDSGDFDYRLAFTLLQNVRVEPLFINDAHRGKPWPVNCSANLGAPVSQFCSPNFAGVRELFASPISSPASSQTLD